MFVADAVILSDIAAVLKKTGSAALEAWWTTIVALEHQSAYDDILTALIGRGYSLATILQWSAGATVERRHALYRSLVAGAALDDFSDRFLDKLDQSEFLKTCLLYDSSGAQLFPDLEAAGTIGHGREDVSEDIFVWPPVDDSPPLPASELGDTTRF